jgi:hypothetical protein
MTVRLHFHTDKLDLADELPDEFMERLKEPVKQAGALLVAEVKRRLSLAQGDASTSAKEGDPPERDSGALVDSVKQLRTNIKPTIAETGVHVRHEGAARLEWGKTDVRGIRTYPHPFIRPSAAAVAKQAGEMIAKALE